MHVRQTRGMHVAEMIDHKRKFAWVHIPKTGGQSLLSLYGIPKTKHGRAFKPFIKKRLSKLWCRWTKTKRGPVSFIKDGLQHRYGHARIEDLLDEKNQSYAWGAWLRDPVERLFSSFKYLKSGGCNLGDKKYAKKYLKPYNTFQELVEAMPDVHFRHHLETQAFFLKGAEKLTAQVEIFEFSQFITSIKTLQKNKRLPAGDIPHVNKSSSETMNLPPGLIEKLRRLYLVDYMLLGNNEISIKRWSPRSLFSGPLALVFYDAGYEAWFEPWMHSFRKKNKLTVVPIFLKQEADRPRRNAVNVDWDGQRENIWRVRMHVIWSFIASGLDVFHFDLDARVYGNLITLIDPQTNMAFSQGTIFPIEVASRHGLVVCCGAFFVRSNQSSRRFFTKVAAKMEIDGNDQRQINVLLFENKPNVIPSKRKREFSQACYGYEFSWSYEPTYIVDKKNGITTCVWPMNKASRLAELPSDETVIWHPCMMGAQQMRGEKNASRFNMIFNVDHHERKELLSKILTSGRNRATAQSAQHSWGK